MSAQPGPVGPTPRFRLRTFGTVAIAGAAEGQSLSHQGPQRRRLAFLTVLAASGERGRSRDQLLGLFWPEVPQDRARHSLEQSIYAIRSSLDPAIFVGVNPIGLNRHVLSSDVDDFERAIGQGDPETAVERYAGPFLEGFYLEDAPEFERWAESERARLHGLYTRILEDLAHTAVTGHDHTRAVRWWKRLVDADPVSGLNAIGLMRALAAAGDHAAALRHADRYQETVERELQTGIGPDVAAVVAELRSPTRSTSRNAPASGGIDSPPGPPRSGVPFEPAAAPSPVGGRSRAIRYGAGLLIAAAVVLGTLRLIRWSPGSGAAAAGTEPSIVVLPLANLGSDPGDAALADGMTEELIAMLAQRSGLRVIASTSAFAFKGRSLDVRRIADSLRVSYVLEGGLQRIGSQLRLQVRLVQAIDGATRWSETYDREMQDLFATEDDLAGAVARELAVRLERSGPTKLLRHQTRNVAAYELYLRGRDPILLRSDSGVRAGLEYFSRAIATDSGFAAAYAGLAHMYAVLGLGGNAGVPIRALNALGEAAAKKAIALDDSLAEAHAELGLVRLGGVTDLGSAESEFRLALALDPAQPRVHEYLAVLYEFTGRFGEALTEARRDVERDPLSPTANVELARALYFNGRCDAALAQLQIVAGLRPPLRRAAVVTGLCLAEQGKWPEAIAVLQEASEAGGLRARAMLGLVLARAGRQEEARRILSDLLARQQGNGNFGFEIAAVYSALGDLDRSFGWLDTALAERSLSPYVMGPAFRALRRDPRFERLRERLGLPSR